MNHGNFGTGKHNFGYIPEPNSGVCADAAFDERLCETCMYYEEHHGMPLCNGNEYKEIEDEDRG